MAQEEHPSLADFMAAYIQGNPNLTLADVVRLVYDELRGLAESGRLRLGEDKDLTGESLEVRVFLLLKSVGLAVSRGRPGHEDIVVQSPSDAKTIRPLVIEVKSDRKPSVQRDDLRQLDDWVFDLSQEEVARKQGLGGGFDPLAMATNGLISQKHQHPSPHKGVLIFNAPVGVPFINRTASCMSSDELAFAAKRNFCVMPLNSLVDAAQAIVQGKTSLVEFWEHVQQCEGEFKWTA